MPVRLLPLTTLLLALVGSASLATAQQPAQGQPSQGPPVQGTPAQVQPAPLSPLFNSAPPAPGPVYGPQPAYSPRPFYYFDEPLALADIFEPPATGFGLGNLFSTSGATAQMRSPYMIGDVDAAGCGSIGTADGTATLVEHPTFSCNRLNVAENNSPIPSDRIYFRYNHLHNATETSFAGLTAAPIDSELNIDRFTFGLEKTAFDERMSFEVRLPFARQLTNDIQITSVDGANNLPLDDTNVQFGNMSVLAKALLYDNRRFAMSGGVGVLIPTAPDVNFDLFVQETGPGLLATPFTFNFSGKVRNRVVDITPFLAALWTPDDRWFAQGFLQVSVPANTEGVKFNQSFTTPGGTIAPPTFEDAFRPQTILRANAGGGYWVVRNPRARHLTGLAMSVEAHYTGTLNDADLIENFNLAFTPNDVSVGNFANRIDYVNLTVGPTFEFHRRTTLATGFVVPLREWADQAFDFEFNLQLNHRF